MEGELYKKFMKKLEEEEKNKIQEEKNKKIIEDKDEIINVDINLLDEFKNHIFSVLNENKYQELKESISNYGVLNPIIIRKKLNGRYEIISGHNRYRCCKDLGKETIPAIVKNYDDVIAKLIMIDTNLAQREEIPPCEKGVAYKMKYELIKSIRRNGGSVDEFGIKVPMGLEGRSIDKLAEESEDSITQIKRFMRLAELNDNLKNKVNSGIIGVRAGVELSYLNLEEQDAIADVMDEKGIRLSTVEAKKLREAKVLIDRSNVLEIIEKREKKDKLTGKVSMSVLKKYKDRFSNDKELSELVDFLLGEYFRKMSVEWRTFFVVVGLVESSAFKLC